MKGLRLPEKNITGNEPKSRNNIGICDWLAPSADLFKKKEVNMVISAYAIPGIRPVGDPVQVLQNCGLKPVNELVGKSKKADLVTDRKLYMYYLVKLYGYKKTDAGGIFNKDHATVVHAIKTLTDWRDTDKKILLRMRKIEVRIDNFFSESMNYKEYFVLEKKIQLLGFDVERKVLIDLFTNGRTDSLRALKVHEYIEFIDWLKERFKLSKEHKYNWMKDPANKMRQKLWALFVVKMQYDEHRYNAWFVQYGKFHKTIKEHTYEELVEVVSQAELVYKSYMGEIKKPGLLVNSLKLNF